MLEVFLFILLIVSGKSQVAEISAPATVNIQNEEVRVKCSPDNDFNFISRIEIERKPATESTFSTLLVVEDPPRGSEPVFRDDELGSRATAEGRAGRPSGAFLTLIIPQGRVNCKDGGLYHCKIIDNVSNVSRTITSSTVPVTILVNPETPATFSLSPSNIPGTVSSVYTYLKGTTIMLVCQTVVGSPQNQVRLCYQPAGVNNFIPLTNIVSNVTVPQSLETTKSCILTRTIVASAVINDDAGKFYCEAYESGRNAGCGNTSRVRDAMFTAQDFPVCNSSTIATSRTSTTTTTTTTTGASIENNVEVLAVTGSEGFTLLLLGCGLIALSGALFAASLIIFMKAKKLKKRAEMTMIRSTYDSVHFRATPAPNYTSLEDLREPSRRPLEKQDSDGYMVPSVGNFQ